MSKQNIMKNLGLAFLFLFLLISLSAQEPVDPNGFHTFHYPNGQKSSEGWLKDGQPEGWWKSYSEEGVLLSEGNRKNHLLDSLWTFYDKEGNKILEINYKEGKKNGPRIQYFKDEYTIENWTMDTLKGWVYTYSSEGWLKRATPYEKGKPHGLEKEYNRNGLITSIKTYFRGVLTRREYINRSDKSGKQGPWKYFWDNGNLRMEGSYLNDKKHGFFKTYDENGNFLAVEKYENDQLIADAKETKTLQKKVAYHPNGKPSITATYYNGKPDGIRREFDSTGKIIKGYLFSDGRLTHEGITDLNGKRQGIWKEFYETGELKSMGRYKNSTPVGEWKFFFPDKTVEISGEYNAKGQKEGEWKWFYPNGNLLMVENYEDGELEGNFVEYDENENEITQGQYIEGQEDGVWLYVRGNAKERGSYYEGMRTGTWKTWYDDGKLASEIHYEQDLPDGKYVTYWPSGQQKVVGRYITGERAGIWYKYNEEGALIFSTTYKDGMEVRWNNYVIGDL